MATFYICSYGGCGSKCLQSHLKKHGKTYHVHDPEPPILLEGVGDNILHNFKYQQARTHTEFFNKKIIPSSELNNNFVIYIYKNPVKSIISRYIPKYALENGNYRAALENIKANPDISLEQMVETQSDGYQLEKFFDNYTTPNKKRNYKIICVKYEELWNNIEKLEEILNIKSKTPFPKREERNNSIDSNLKSNLEKIYLPLNKKMSDMNPIEIR